MIDELTTGRDRADDPVRFAQATRILSAPYVPPPLHAPALTVLAGHILFVPVSHIAHEACGAAKRFADAHDLDLVLVDRSPPTEAGAQRVRFTLGISFHRQRVWRYDHRLWRPADGGPACFVPPDRRPERCHGIENGRLFGVEGAPWRDRHDQARGFATADLGLTRLVEGR